MTVNMESGFIAVIESSEDAYVLTEDNESVPEADSRESAAMPATDAVSTAVTTESKTAPAESILTPAESNIIPVESKAAPSESISIAAVESDYGIHRPFIGCHLHFNQ